jgi:hypothetical protein
MYERSASLLTPEQQEFLNRIVANDHAGVHSPFIFTDSHSGPAVTYAGATYLAWRPGIHEIDLEQLFQAGLITVKEVSLSGGRAAAGHQYFGKPTALAIEHFTAPTESPEKRNQHRTWGNGPLVLPKE